MSIMSIIIQSTIVEEINVDIRLFFCLFRLTKDCHGDNYKFMIWVHSRNTLVAPLQ